MPLIGLEINDSGILAAGGSPPGLLDLDGALQESPGFALPQKKGLLVGKTAADQALLFPRQILNRFWDQLNTEPLEQGGKYFPQNHAEIVYHHLALIWQQLQARGDQIVMAVPSFYDREQLGLILGIAQELGMPVRGFLPLSLAAAAPVDPARMLLHLDIHLHRIEVVYLEQGEDLTVRDSATTADKGLLRLYRQWVEMIAREFVRTTRFDPLHQAALEQQLYDRLPGVLTHFEHNSSMLFEITGGATPYRITLQREGIIGEAESIFSEILRLIKRMQNKRGQDRAPLALLLSHRLARLPGCRQMLATLKDARIVELEPGAAARGVPRIWHRLAAQANNQGISFFTSRPWQDRQPAADQLPAAEKTAPAAATHLLYRSLAYPITEKPLTIGCTQDSEQNDITITGAATGVSPRHCTVELRDREIILHVMSDRETFVDDIRVSGDIALRLGQVIRVGNSGEQFQVIACLNSSDEK